MKRTVEDARRPEDRQRAEAHAQPAAATPAGNVLALQRSAGNRAVTALLARDATKPAPKPKEEAAPQGAAARVIFPGIGEIPVDSVQWGASGSPGKGDQGPKEIFFSSKTGEHSDKLMQAMLRGEAKDVEVIMQGSEGKLLRLKLKKAIVQTYQVSSGGGEPTEAWSLNCESIEFEHEGAKEEGGDYDY